MASETPTDGRCNAGAWLDEQEREDPEASKSGYCDSWPVKDDDGEPITGHCRMHNGYGDGAPEGNGNAITHGVQASPANLYTHLDESERDWIDDLAEDYIEIAPFGPENPLAERVIRLCTMMYQEWKAAGIVEVEGPSENRPVVAGETVTYRDEEHHLSRRELQLNAKVRQGLKSLGCLPGSRPGDGESDNDTIAQIFKLAVEQAAERESDTEYVESDPVDV